jgi:hypothetical protein
MLAEDTGLAYPRKLIENIVLGLSDPINDHLVKLVGFNFPKKRANIFSASYGLGSKKSRYLGSTRVIERVR